MASLLFISEYPRSTVTQTNVAQEPSTVSQVVSYAGGSTQSAAFRADTYMVRLHTDSICAYKFGTNPTAVSGTDARMAANQTEYFKVNPALKVAAVITT
jgi:hypothetical protein